MLLVASITISAVFISSQTTYAAPGKINYQGRLADAAGTAKPDGQYNMKFRIYDAASGGTLLWSEVRETTDRVTVTNGQFNVQLGSVTTIPDSVFASDATYFEIELPTPATATCSTAACGTYTEGAMTPRQPVASAAYAMQANNASTIDGIDGVNIATKSGNNSFAGSNDFSGEVNFNDIVFHNANADFNGSVMMVGADNASKLWITNTIGTTLFKADTANMLVKVGTDASASLANVRLLTTSAEFNGTVRIGTATDGVDISGANGVLLSGTARRTTSINLMPEYANSVLDAGSGSNNTGSMTSKLDLTNRRNYYKWTTTSGTAQSYDVVVQVPIPSDFSAWATTTPISVDTYTSNTTTGTVTIEARDTAGTTVSGIDFVSVTPTATTTWETKSAGTISGTFTAGGYMTLRIRMASPTSGDVRISNIKLDYLSKW